jgi:hypothetical protein|nr:MAG TPA: hypothetical protein [Caudoviricetes sp.]
MNESIFNKIWNYIVKLNRSQYLECAKNSLEFRGFIGQLTKANLPRSGGVDRASAVFLRVHGDSPHFIPLQYGCGYIFMIVQPPIELSQNHFLLLCRVTALL